MAQIAAETELDNLSILEPKVKEKRPTKSILKRLYNGFKKLAKGINTLWILIPLVALIEVAITLPLATVHPDHKLHLAYYCTGCNTNVDTLYSALVTSEKSCISDAILMDIGESYQGFIQNYLATMLGHVLTVYALINTQDQSLSATMGTKEMLHILAYGLLLLDIIFEIWFLEEIEMTDPTGISLSSYTACDDTVVSEVENHKTALVEFAYYVLTFRVVVSFFVVFIYVIKADVRFDDESDDEVDKTEAGAIEQKSLMDKGSNGDITTLPA